MRGVKVRLRLFLTTRNLHLFLNTKLGKKAANTRDKFTRNILKFLAEGKKVLQKEKLLWQISKNKDGKGLDLKRN